ncbi:hypothetical protein J5N97_005942 [Dioscorea zingiberensis]|uniref:RRM domain-containing protein n=1 Tax=Dioscorea zingiberensis TaxID=325984 RepID=A0A9D5HT90_9LILI|nr:hypothetical protein J5N97_005942 [Dioscorea zingiberensis]
MLLRSLSSRLISTTTSSSSFLSILQQNHSNPNLELTLSRSPLPLTPSTIQSVLDSITSLPVPALRFFVWAGLHRSHRHSAFAYAAASHSLRLRSHPEALLLLLDSYRRSSVPVSLRTFKILLNLCLHSNLVSPALSLLNQMPTFGCRPDTPFFNTLFRLLVHNLETHHTSIAVKLFDEMLAAGLRPDMITYVLVIRALCAASRVSDACGIVSQMRANGCAPNKVVLSALFEGACAAGELDTAMKILGEMEAGDDRACAPNVVTYTCLMKWLCEKGMLEEALGVLARMGSRECRPNRVTVRTLLAGFCSQGRVDNAYELVDRMVGEGSVSSEECHSLLVICLLSIGDSAAAERIMRMMLEKGLRPDALATNSLVKELCSETRFIEAYRWFGELEENGGVLWFSSDVYSQLLVGLCNQGHKDEALVVVRRVVERGVQVDAACADVVVEMLRRIGEDHLASKGSIFGFSRRSKNQFSIPCKSLAMAVKTVLVSNISLAATERDVKEFFSFSGDIDYIEIQSESASTQRAFVTFKDTQGAETAMLLSGATIVDLSVNITPVEDYQLPPEAYKQILERKLPPAGSAVRKAEDAVSSMLAMGFVLGKDALNQAKAFDERHHLISNASATVASLDNKIGLTEKISMGTALISGKVREVDERFQVSEITKSAFAAAEQTASSAGSVLMSNQYVSTGASWFSSAFDKVVKAAGDLSVMTKEKVDKAEEEKNENISRERTEMVHEYAQLHLDETLSEDPPIVHASSHDDKINLAII